MAGVVAAVVTEVVVAVVVCCVTEAFALDEPPFEPQETSVTAHSTAAAAAASLCILIFKIYSTPFVYIIIHLA